MLRHVDECVRRDSRRHGSLEHRCGAADEGVHGPVGGGAGFHIQETHARDPSHRTADGIDHLKQVALMSITIDHGAGSIRMII